MRFLADENISLSVVNFLMARGHDVLTLSDIKKTGISDEEVAEIGEKENRIVLTLDSDFGYIYYFARRERINIVVLKPCTPTPESVKKLLETLLELKAELRGLVIVTEKKVRIIR